jgi:hypothetical protein
MFAESPGLNAVEHPVFDVWLTACEDPKIPEAAAGDPAAGTPAPAADGAEDLPRRRVRR